MSEAATGSVDPRVTRSVNAVVDAAVGLLLDGGTQAVTIDAVVARSGVAKSTIYRHWETRADVLRAAFDRLLPSIPDLPEEVPLADGLRLVLGRLAEALAEAEWVSVIPALLDAAGRDPDLAGLRDRLAAEHRAPLTAMVERAKLRGELGAGTDVSEAVSLLAGPLVYRRLIAQERSDQPFVDRLVEGFLRREPDGGATTARATGVA